MLITLEVSEERAREARENFARAGVADRTTIVVGDAKLKIAKVAGPFDLIFLDTDKQLYLSLLDRLVSLLRPGGLLVTDNVLWSGEVVPGYVPHPTKPAADTQALIAFNERVAMHPELLTTVVPLRDGVSISVKKR
jgi:predicted O-methyltransferase YrrM